MMKPRYYNLYKQIEKKKRRDRFLEGALATTALIGSLVMNVNSISSNAIASDSVGGGVTSAEVTLISGGAGDVVTYDNFDIEKNPSDKKTVCLRALKEDVKRFRISPNSSVTYETDGFCFDYLEEDKKLKETSTSFNKSNQCYYKTNDNFTFSLSDKNGVVFNIPEMSRESGNEGERLKKKLEEKLVNEGITSGKIVFDSKNYQINNGKIQGNFANQVLEHRNCVNNDLKIAYVGDSSGSGSGSEEGGDVKKEKEDFGIPIPLYGTPNEKLPAYVKKDKSSGGWKVYIYDKYVNGKPYNPEVESNKYWKKSEIQRGILKSALDPMTFKNVTLAKYQHALAEGLTKEKLLEYLNDLEVKIDDTKTSCLENSLTFVGCRSFTSNDIARAGRALGAYIYSAQKRNGFERLRSFAEKSSWADLHRTPVGYFLLFNISAGNSTNYTTKSVPSEVKEKILRIDQTCEKEGNVNNLLTCNFNETLKYLNSRGGD